MIAPTTHVRKPSICAVALAVLALLAQADSSQGEEPGEHQYTLAGTYSWTAPAGITSISVVAIGGAGSNSGTSWSSGGGGGGLAYKNGITVVPGNTYTVVVGAAGQRGVKGSGGTSYFIDTSTVAASGGETTDQNFGRSNKPGGTVLAGDGGGAGGRGGYYNSDFTGYAGGGGGAGGYSGTGGDGGSNVAEHSVQVSAGSGGAGGG